MNLTPTPVASTLKYAANCRLVAELLHYENDRPAIRLFDSETGEPACTATVNLPRERMAKDEIAVKAYSENEGVTEWLIAADIIEPEARRTVRSGFAAIEIYPLTLRVQTLIREAYE